VQRDFHKRCEVDPDFGRSVEDELTAFHATVRTARKKSGFKAGLRQREKFDLERG